MAKTKTQAEARDKAAPGPIIQKQPETPEKQSGPFLAARTTASALPPPNGTPPPARAADLMTAPEQSAGAADRARMMRAMQGTVGNARLSRMLGTTVQAKLTVGAPDDAYEREADQTADWVMRVPEPPEAGPSQAEPSEIQRQAADQAGGDRASTREPGQALAVTPEVESYLQTSRGGGQPLPPATQASMGDRFGQDFSKVRVHAGPESAGAAKSLQAQAFTQGQDIHFGAGRYQPESPRGQRLLAHELAHVGQQEGNRGTKLNGLSAHLVRGKRLIQCKDDEETAQTDPLAGWRRTSGSLLVVGTGDQVYILPGTNLVYTPSKGALERMRTTRAHHAHDVGTLFGVPATGASGTRFVRSGKRTAIVLDAGRGAGVPAAVYLGQVQALMARMGVSRIGQLRLLHVHRDHVSEIPSIVQSFGLSPSKVVIPEPFVRGRVNSSLQRAIDALTALGNTNAAWRGWSPGTPIRNKGGQGDILRTRIQHGDVVIEQVALRSALRNITSRTADLASFLTKVTRRSDGAKALVLGDLRMRDLARFEQAMGSAQWNAFVGGVEILSGFSHHGGAMTSQDIQGLMKLLDATLLRTGRLRAVIQSDPTRHRRARSDTLEFMRRIGVEVVFADAASGTTSPSDASATRDAVRGEGPASRTPGLIDSPLTRGIQRLARLRDVRQILEMWRPVMVARGVPASELRQGLAEIDSSISTLASSLKLSIQAAGQVRTEGQGTASGGRDYSDKGGQKGRDYQDTLSKIPVETLAEKNIGEQNLQRIEKLGRDIRSRKGAMEQIPLQAALEAAIRQGVYSDQAFRYMLSQMDPTTRRSILTGKRGGPRPRLNQFQRLRAEFGFRSSVLPSGQFLSLRGMPRGRARVARGIAGWLAIIEAVNLFAEVHRSVQISQSINADHNVVPFVRRLMFWNQLGVRPRIVGVDDGIFSIDYQRDYDSVVQGISSNDWDAVYIEHSDDRPAISNADILRLGVVLTNNVRNYDEFATLFIDSDQDAVLWETKGSGGWQDAVWKVRVGHYETSGTNRVAERWVEIPLLSQMMSVFTARIIANTEAILKLRERGQAPRPGETESELGGLTTSFGRPKYRARLRNNVETSTVYVRTQGTQMALLPRQVTWWSTPMFYVFDVGSSNATVGGADHNTYAILRRLKTESRQLSMGAGGRTWISTLIVGNAAGLVEIPADQIERIP